MIYELAAADSTFVTQLRDQGLIPGVSETFPDAAYVTDANAICKLLAFPGETDEVQRTDLVNMRKNRVTGYGITEAQATEVMILSAETYCPSQVETIKRALA